MLEALEVEPNPNSVEVMRFVDALPAAMRGLVHEFGVKIVEAMYGEGYHDAEELRGLLETWRDRRQAQWLATDYVIGKRAFLGR